jgi:hypothetical protein
VQVTRHSRVQITARFAGMDSISVSGASIRPLGFCNGQGFSTRTLLTTH